MTAQTQPEAREITHTSGELTLHPHGRITAGEFHRYTNGSAQDQIAMVTGMTSGRIPDTDLHRDANARRLVACWNACKDIDTESLAQIGGMSGRIAELEAELVREAQRTAAEKLRADQMTEQHRMQSAMNAEARGELAQLREKRHPFSECQWRAGDLGALASAIQSKETTQ